MPPGGQHYPKEVDEMPRVAVSGSLTNVSDYLREHGYEVVSIQGQQENLGQVDALVISGENENMMGMMDVQADCPVINAEGMSAEQVYRELMRRIPQ